MKSILVASLAMMSGYYSSPLALSHIESEREVAVASLFEPVEDLDLEKYLTNRSPKRLQSLLASMAHARYRTQWRTRTKVGPTPALSTEYKLARFKQLNAKREHEFRLSLEEEQEHSTLFNSLPRRIRRQLNHGKSSL